MTSPPSRSSSPDPGPQRQTRIRLERKVSLKFKNLEGFVTELSENISMGGMFLRTTDPAPPGTLFDFELTLEEEGPLIQGIAEVVWVRDRPGGPRRPAGMGVRFLELAPGSRALIYQVVDEHIVAGGEPFSLQETPAPERPSEPEGAAPESAAPETAAADRRSGTVRAGSYAVLASPQRKQVDGSFRARRAGGWLDGLRGGSRRIAWLAGALLLVGSAIATVLWMLPEGESEPGGASTSPREAAPESLAPADATDAPDAPDAPDATDASDVTDATETTETTEATEATEATESPGAPPRDRLDAVVPGSAETNRETTKAEDGETADAGPVSATALQDVTWRRQGAALVVTLTADGALLDERWDRFRMDEGTPREVVRIRGIGERHRPSIPVGEPELLRIRTGHHRTPRGDELHVVLDLGSPRVRLLGTETDGRRLHLTLAERE